MQLFDLAEVINVKVTVSSKDGMQWYADLSKVYIRKDEATTSGAFAGPCRTPEQAIANLAKCISGKIIEWEHFDPLTGEPHVVRFQLPDVETLYDENNYPPKGT